MPSRIMSSSRTRYALGAVLAVASCAAIGLYAQRENDRPPVLEVFVFDMSAGRALFIRTPDDKRIVVDAGAASEIIKHITRILPFYSRRIDAVIATSLNGKDMSGLADVVERYAVGRAYAPSVAPESAGTGAAPDQIYQEFLRRLESRHVPAVLISAGDVIEISSAVRIQALFPARPGVFTYSKTRISELAFTIGFGSTSVAYMAAASKKVQAFIASSTVFLGQAPAPGGGHQDVLIFSRSNAAASLSRDFLAVSRPDRVIFSGSKIKKNQPDKAASASSRKLSREAIEVGDILRGIESIDIRRVGSVRIVSDGRRVSVEPWE